MHFAETLVLGAAVHATAAMQHPAGLATRLTTSQIRYAPVQRNTAEHPREPRDVERSTKYGEYLSRTGTKDTHAHHFHLLIVNLMKRLQKYICMGAHRSHFEGVTASRLHGELHTMKVMKQARLWVVTTTTIASGLQPPKSITHPHTELPGKLQPEPPALAAADTIETNTGLRPSQTLRRWRRGAPTLSEGRAAVGDDVVCMLADSSHLKHRRHARASN